MISPLQRVRKETRMSDYFSGEPGQEDAALAPELARLDELLLAEGRRWRRHEPSTARLERHLRTLTRSDAAPTRTEERMLTERNHMLDTPAPHPLPRRAPPRWRGPLAVVATVLLIAMAATIFAFGAQRMGTGNGRQTAKATPTPAVTRVTAIQPKDIHLPMPKNAYLSDISLSSAHDGWAVGGWVNSSILNQSGGPVDALLGVLVHYHDGIWMPAIDFFPGIDLDSVSMVSANDGWAVGFSPLNAATDRSGSAVLLHYTRGHWVMVKTPALANTHPRTIRMLSPDFGYITGVINVPSPTGKGAIQLVELVVYQNGVWKPVDTPFAAFTSQVVMVSASEGWASALAATPGIQQATIYHYLNGVWTKSLTFPGYITSMSAASRADVWALAYQCANCREAPTVRIEHYNGTTWEPVSPPSQSDFMKIPGFGAGALVQLTIFDGAAGGVWIVCAAQDTPKPPSQLTYSAAMWVHGLNGNDNWLSASPSITGGLVTTLATDGNGGTWAVVQSDNPFATTVLYSQGTDWEVYGRSR